MFFTLLINHLSIKFQEVMALSPVYTHPTAAVFVPGSFNRHTPANRPPGLMARFPLTPASNALLGSCLIGRTPLLHSDHRLLLYFVLIYTAKSFRVENNLLRQYPHDYSLATALIFVSVDFWVQFFITTSDIFINCQICSALSWMMFS